MRTKSLTRKFTKIPEILKNICRKSVRYNSDVGGVASNGGWHNVFLVRHRLPGITCQPNRIALFSAH